MRDYICAIDIGSSVTRALVGRPDEGEQIEIVGVGSAPTQGVKNGIIINMETCVQGISRAVREAELMSGLVFDEATVNVAGRHIHGENSRGVVAVTNAERVVREDDVFRVIEGAQNIRIPGDQEILHVLSREFTVDDQSGIRDPVGMNAVRLESAVHIVTAGSVVMSNLEKSLSTAGIVMQSAVMNSLASAEAILTEGEKDLGVAVVDIGGGVVDVIVYLNGGVFFSSVLPVGGIHVTQDLSIGLKIPLDRAEVLKKTYGMAKSDLVDPTEKLEIPGIHGRPSRWVLRQQISEIIEPRMNEVFEMVDRELGRSGVKKQLTGGVVVTGGGSLIEGALSLADQVLGLPVNMGYPNNIKGFTDRVNGPEFSTSVGLLQYSRKTTGFFSGERGGGRERKKEGNFFDRVKNWISDNL